MADTHIPTRPEVRSTLHELRRLLDDFEAGAIVPQYDANGNKIEPIRTPDVLYMLDLGRAARTAARDGRRSNTRLGVHSPANVKDENGDTMPPLSDPVGELAVSDDRIADPIVRYLSSVLRGLDSALGDLRLARVSMVAGLVDVRADDGEPGCSCHAEIGVFEEVTLLAPNSLRCTWCYKFWLAYGMDPPVDLLRDKQDGKRITEPMITESLKPLKAQTKRRAKRKARSHG